MKIYNVTNYIGNTIAVTSVTNFLASRAILSEDIFWAANNDIVKCSVTGCYFILVGDFNPSDPIIDFTSYVTTHITMAKLILNVNGLPFGAYNPLITSARIFVKLDHALDNILTTWASSSQVSPISVRYVSKVLKPKFIALANGVTELEVINV